MGFSVFLVYCFRLWENMGSAEAPEKGYPGCYVIIFAIILYEIKHKLCFYFLKMQANLPESNWSAAEFMLNCLFGVSGITLFENYIRLTYDIATFSYNMVIESKIIVYWRRRLWRAWSLTRILMDFLYVLI